MASNYSTTTIIGRFLSNPEKTIERSRALHFRHYVLYSGNTPIAYFDPIVKLFVTLDEPPTPTGWVTYHLRAFINQHPAAVRLPTLGATREQTEAYFKLQIANSASPEQRVAYENKMHLALFYLDTGGSQPKPPEPLPPRIPKPTSASTSFADSYEAVANVYVQDPFAIISHRSLISRSTNSKLTMRGTTLAQSTSPDPHDPDPNSEPLLLIRAYDMRKLFRTVISDLIYYASHHNKPYLIVPDPDQNIDYLSQLNKFTGLLDALATTAANYKIDCAAARDAAKIYRDTYDARSKFITYYDIDPTLNQYDPPEDTLTNLRKYGAYRSDQTTVK